MRSTAGDLVSVVEAAYHLALDDAGWTEALLERVAPLLDGGFGVAAIGYRRTRGALRWARPVMRDVGSVHALALTTAMKVTPRAILGRVLDTPSWATSASQVIGPGFPSHPLTRALGHPHGMHDVVTVNVHGLDGRGLVFAAAQRSLRTISRAERRRWAMCTAHVAAAMRLRGDGDGGCADARLGRDDVEAVLDPSGRVVHAEGLARDGDARAALCEGALAMARARGALREHEPELALDVWQGLVDGRWSLVERFESDGRRYIVARRNDPLVLDPRALSLRERQVAAYAVRGHPIKLIAYELGLRPSTVSTHLKSAMRKLGAKTRADLAALVMSDGTDDA